MTERIEWLQKVVILVIFFSLCLSAEEITKIQLNNLQEYSILALEGGKEYYTATLEEDENTDLIVQLNCLSVFCDAALTVFIQKDLIPNLEERPFCKAKDSYFYTDVCVIQKKEIENINQQGLKILIEVSCQHQCKYSLNLVYQKKIQYQAEKGGKINIFFNEAEIREILLQIPNIHATNMLIHVKFINRFSFDENHLDVYGYKGENIPETKQKAMLNSVWISDRTLAIPLSSKELCVNCSFSIAIKAPYQAVVQFSAFLYNNEREINKSEDHFNDIVKQDEIQQYTIKFDDMLEYDNSIVFEGEGKNRKFVSSFLFKLTPYNGNPDLYIHYGENRPSSIENYLWKSDSSSRQDLIFVKSDELNQISYTQNSKIFIAVLGKENSAFELKTVVYEGDSSNSQYIYLENNRQITGYVGKQKIQKYIFMTNGQKRDIDIVLQSYSGNPDLFVKVVKRSDNGEPDISNEEIQKFFQILNNDQSNQNQKIPFIGWSTNKQGKDVVKIKYDPDNCYDSEEYYFIKPDFCMYLIAIFGNEESNKYMIGTYSKEPNSIKQIIENQEEYIFEGENHERYFFYQPMALDTEIEQIRFQIQFSSGFAIIAADREFQNFQAKPERDSNSSKQNDYVEYNQSEIKSGKLCDYKYYIQIKSTEHTIGYLEVKIIRKGQQKVEYTELLSGFSQKLIINPKSSKLFKFIHQFGKDQTVVARSDSLIKMYIGKDENLPLTNNSNIYDADSNIQSSNTVKRINIKSSLSVKESYLFGSVENTQDKEITVLLQSQSDSINIDLNVSYEDILIPNVQRTYQFNIYPDIAKEEIYLFVQPSGTVLEQKLTGFFKINGKQVGEFKDNDPIKMYKVEQEILRKECIYLFEEGLWQDCQVMIEVKSSVEQILIVSVNGPNRPSYISYYGSTISQIPLVKETRKFLYYIYGDQELILTVQSYSYQVQLLSKIITSYQFKQMNVSNGNSFPKLDTDSENIQLITKPNLTHQIRIYPETNKGESCFEGCFLMLSVVLPQNVEISDKKAIGNIIKLSISGDKIIDLVEGHSIQGTVEKEEMLYYRVYVPIEKNKEKLFINLTPLDNGNPDLFLNKDSSKLPTVKEFDLKSQDISGDYLFVDKNTFKNSKSSDSIAGYYIVGVYGESKSTYYISYHTGKHRIQKIERDSIQQSTINKGDFQYYVFHKKEKGFFTVVTNMSSGSAGDYYILIKEFMSEDSKVKDFMENLENPDKVDITTQHSNNKDILRFEKHDCDNCAYVIGVKAERNISISLSVNLDGGVAQIQNNKNNLIYLKKGVISYLRFYSNDDFNLYVSAYSGHCVDVHINYWKDQLKEQLKTKQCKDSGDAKPSGFDGFNMFIKHPDNESSKQGRLHKLSIFEIKIISQEGDEKVIVQGVTGREARLISAGVPLEQTISPENNLAQFTYYSRHEGLQSVQVHIFPEIGSEDALTFIDQFNMTILDQGISALSNTIAHTKDLYAKSFITSMNIPYILNVKYKGVRDFKFSVLLKETNLSNISILNGKVIDELPLQETSNYVIFVKPQQYVLIQSFNCISDQNVFVYTNSRDMLSQNSNAEKVARKSMSYHEIQIMKINQDNQGEIYIQKRTTKQSSEKKSISLIQSEIFQEDEPIIYNYIQIADSGILDVKQDDNKIEISFKDIECSEADCQNVRGLNFAQIEYILHISENSKDLQRMTNCLLRESSDLSINDAISPISITDFSPIKNQETRKFIIDKELIPKEVNKIYVQVSAKVFMTNQNSYRFIYGYHIINDLHSRVTIVEDQSDSNLGFIIAICVVIILLIIVLQLYRRNKQVYKKLQYEMNDVRNVAYSDLEKDTSSGRETNTVFPDKGQPEMIEMK